MSRLDFAGEFPCAAFLICEPFRIHGVAGGGASHGHAAGFVVAGNNDQSVIGMFFGELDCSFYSFVESEHFTEIACCFIVVAAGVYCSSFDHEKKSFGIFQQFDPFGGHFSKDNPAAKGCNSLIRDGAGLIECFNDVAMALGMGYSVPIDERTPDLPADSDLDELSKKICRLLENGETGFDEMQTVLNADTGALLSSLMKLELKMLIELTPEQRYRRMV